MRRTGLAADVMGHADNCVIARNRRGSAKLCYPDIDGSAMSFVDYDGGAHRGFLQHFKNGLGIWHRRMRFAIARIGDPDLSAELPSRLSRQARSSPKGRAQASPGQAAWLTNARRRSMGKASRRCDIAKFQRELGAHGLQVPFITLAGFHSFNHGMFELAPVVQGFASVAYSSCRSGIRFRGQRYTANQATSAKSARANSTPVSIGLFTGGKSSNPPR